MFMVVTIGLRQLCASALAGTLVASSEFLPARDSANLRASLAKKRAHVVEQGQNSNAKAVA